MSNALTRYNALVAELEPYTVSHLTLCKALADVGFVNVDETYTPDNDRKDIAMATISVLKKLIVLTSDSLGKSSQGYSVDQLRKRIRDLESEIGIDDDNADSQSSITDGSNMW